MEFQGKPTDIAKTHHYSGNVHDCNMLDQHRGDIPEVRLKTFILISDVHRLHENIVDKFTMVRRYKNLKLI